MVEDSGVSGGVAKGTDALTLLYNPKTRAQLIDELFEVRKTFCVIIVTKFDYACIDTFGWFHESLLKILSF